MYRKCLYDNTSKALGPPPPLSPILTPGRTWPSPVVKGSVLPQDGKPLIALEWKDWMYSHVFDVWSQLLPSHKGYRGATAVFKMVEQVQKQTHDATMM